MKSFALSFLLASALFVTAQPDSGIAASGDPVVSVQSGDWMTPTTWDCGCIPAFGNDVSIQSGQTIALAAGDTAQAEGLSVSEGAVLEMPRESRLELLSSLVSLGAINGRGTVALTGEGTKVVGPAALEHLACGSGSVTILDTLVISSQLDIDAATLSTGGMLVLKDISGITASGGEISGAVKRSFDYEKSTSFTHMFGPALSGSEASFFLDEPQAVYAKYWQEEETAYLELAPGDILDAGKGMQCSLPEGVYHFDVEGEAVLDAAWEFTANSPSLNWRGWHLMSNPLTGFVDVTKRTDTGGGQLGATYQWVDSLSTYIAQIGGLGMFGHAGIYEPGASFWTVADTGFTASFGQEALVSKETYETQHLRAQQTPLALRVSNGEFMEQCIVALGGGSASYDRAEDAAFVPSFRGRNNVDLYSQSDDGIDLMVNRTSDEAGLVVPILVKATNGTQLTLSADELPNHVCLTIEDIETGWSATVNEDLNYTFSALSNNAVHRFNLILGGGVEATSVDAACASAQDGSISVLGPDGSSTFTLVDANGNPAGTFEADSVGGTFTGLSMGSYTVTALSEVCADLTRTLEVGAGGSGAAPFAIASVPDHIGCYDDHGGVTLEIQGGLEPYTVNWSHGEAGLSIEVEESGILQAVVTDAAGCSDSTTVEVLAAPQVAAGISLEEPVVALIDGEAEVYFDNASTGATGYQWNFGDGGTSTSENPIHTYTAAGAYTVGLNAWNDYCSDTYQMVVTVETVSSVGDLANTLDPTIQRTTQGWQVGHPQEAFGVEVFDLTGRIVYRTSGGVNQSALLEFEVLPHVALVHWTGESTGHQKTWRIAR